MKSKLQLTDIQRELRLIELIKDCKELGFKKDLVQKFTKQLIEVQAQIRADREKAKELKTNILRERELKKVRDSKPLVPQLNAITTS